MRPRTNSGHSLSRFSVPNVEFIVMPSKLAETNPGADCREFYSAFYRSEARNVNRASWVLISRRLGPQEPFSVGL